MQNPPDSRPVYEWDQVVTERDLEAIFNGYVYQYNRIPRWRLLARLRLMVAISVCGQILHWLAHGKPEGKFDCKGD